MSIKKGIYAASMSIINKDLSLDIDSTISHLEKLLNEGCDGAVIFGSTGQSQLISSDEKKKLIKKLKSNKSNDRFIIGTGENSLNQNIEIMKHSLENGINRFLIMPPAYYKYGDDEAYNFFENVIKQVPESEIILYNFEKLSGYKFSSQIIEKLVENFPKQVLGVKDSSYNLYKKIKIPNFLIFPGSETKLIEGLELGCSGIISAVCNVTAPLAHHVYDSYLNKKKQIFYKKLCDIRKVFDEYNLISGLHSFMSIENKKYEFILPPLNLLSKKEEKKMISELKSLDFYPDKSAAA